MIGRRERRVEDNRLVQGEGRYLADIDLPDLKHIAVLRSTEAHARIELIDASQALALPGVVAVFTGEDVAGVCRPMTHHLQIPGVQALEWYPLAIDKVRYVGDPVVAVVADTRAIAEDALELIDLVLEPLPAAVGVEDALAPGAPLLFEEWGTNELLHLEYSNGDPAGALGAAPRVLRERFVNHRIIGLPLEGHGACGHFDAGTGQLTFYVSSQQPHHFRTVVAEVCGLSENDVRVIAPDMGGGFGNKQHFSRDEVLVAVLATQLPYPVRWVQDRVESLTASVHSHEQVHHVEVAFDEAGRVLALSVEIDADLGNPMLYVSGVGPALISSAFLPGAYDIQDYAYILRGTATNKCTSGAYRGYGQPEAHFTIERVMDLVANEVGLDPAEVRRVNLIPDDPRPYLSAVGSRYDVGSMGGQLARLLEEMDYDGWRRRQDEARQEGRLVGIGLSSLIEGTAPTLLGLAGRFGAYEVAQVSVLPDGRVTVSVGTKSQGQGHETVFAQCAASELTVPMGHVAVRDGDTDLLPYGSGTWGSRSATMGGGAVIRASRQLRDKMCRIAAAMLGVTAGDIALADGVFRAGEASLPFEQVAATAWWYTFLLPADEEPGLTTIVVYENRLTSAIPDERGHMNACETYSSATTGVVVEVDPNTGRTHVLDAILVHDCGTVINPMTLEGQIQGGFVQGVGATLLEEIVYAPSGQPLTSTLLDYHIPGFADVPFVRIIHQETPSAIEGGLRGAGEAPIISSTAAIANAVADAVAPVGAVVRQTNLGPHHVRGILREAGVEMDLLRP